MTSNRNRAKDEPEKPEKRTDKPDRDAQERAARERKEREEEELEPVAPSSGRTFETDREGVHSATEGGIPDPSVQPGGGTVTDPIPGAPKPA